MRLLFSKEKFGSCKESDVKEKKVTNISGPSDLNTTNEYCRGQRIPSSGNHNYLILDKQCDARYVAETENNMGIEDHTMGDDENDDYNVIETEDDYAVINDSIEVEEGDYNIADSHNARSKSQVNTGNNYNKVDLDRGGDYDHINRNGKQKMPVGSDDYDKTENVLAHSNSKDQQECDPYNHLRGQGSVNNPGKQCFVVGESAETSNYSRINNKSD